MIAINTALFIADYLVQSGVRRAYAVPDPEIAPALNAFRLRGITIVATESGTVGGMLAAAEDAVHQGVGAVISGAGPGVAEIGPALIQAQVSHRAVIALTIEPDGGESRPSTRGTLDLRTIFASVSKGSYRLTAENARELMPLAWRLATALPRGAVHLRVHSDEMSKSTRGAGGQAHAPAPSNGDRAALVQRASEMIAASSRILVLIGPEVLEAQAETAARLLAEQWEAPVAVTPMAKGAVAETHPLFAGVYGGLGDRAILDLMEQSDLIVGFGVSSADFVHRWRQTSPVVHLTHTGRADPGFPADIVLSGPLNALANQLQRQPARLDRGEARAGETRRAIQQAVLGRIDERALTPQEVIEQLGRLTPAGIPLAVEADLAGLLAAQLWTVTEPGRFLINNGLGLPGSGLALATVAALTRPQQGVLWLGLDTALAARPGFLSYLRELNTNVVLIVINQGVRAELLWAQERAGYPPVASDYPPLNFEALAGTYGLHYRRVRTSTELRSALPEALVANQPVILDVIGDRDSWWRIE